MVRMAHKFLRIAPARILKQQTFQVPGKLKVTEHFFEVPKDYSQPGCDSIKVFGRSVCKHDIPIFSRSNEDDAKNQIPWIVFLNGGPGAACRPPQDYPLTRLLLDRGYQIFFLDQRGTGLSTPACAGTLNKLGNSNVQLEYLKLFRADSIVRDCEAIRQALTEGWPEEKRQWSTIGQSFGGFITMTYLSHYPDSLRECFIFGGLQPLVTNPDQVYDRTYQILARRNQAYYAKFPEDVDRVSSIARYISERPDGRLALPSGGSLTVRRFQQLGFAFGMHGGIDRVHNLILQAACELENFGQLTYTTLCALDTAGGFDQAILFSLLHEPIYCSGEAARWSAHRIREKHPIFNSDVSSGGSEPLHFTGEMIYPWMFEDYAELSKVRDVAELLAAKQGWPALFDVEQLKKNQVPVYAASYSEDMYVDVGLGLETARTIGNCKTFNTNMMYHNALSEKCEEVVAKAFQLRDDTLD